VIRIFGQHQQNTLDQMTETMKHGSAVHGVLCADGHKGYAHPIGGVIAYEDHISISGVGYDIACGNMAVKLDTKAEDLGENGLAAILTDINKHISFGVGRRNDVTVDSELFESSFWGDADVADLKPLARAQLGTVGAGNHYVDILRDYADNHLWIGVHFGSRGLGHKITTKYLEAVGAKDHMDAPPALIEAGTPTADAYLAGVELGGLYAYAGREWVVERVRKIIGGSVLDTVHNHHNFLWRENIDGRNLWVVRKGASPSYPGQRSFVGGSMGDDCAILKGLDTDANRHALYSTVHGAGRIMGRMQAKGKLRRDPETGAKLFTPGMVDHADWKRWLAERDVQVLGGDVDEAPQCYRRLPDVLTEHAETIEVTHLLRPIGVVMAGANEYDPYKD